MNIELVSAKTPVFIHYRVFQKRPVQLRSLYQQMARDMMPYEAGCRHCEFDELKWRKRSPGNRQLTAPLNCTILSDCPARLVCLDRILKLLDALEEGNIVKVRHIMEKRGRMLF